jgi:hypothetical protein
MNVLWKMEWVKSGVSTLGYVDFQIDGIHGVFRAANSDGVDLEKVVSRVEQNRAFFEYVATVGSHKVMEESSTEANWGGGWEWQETKHPLQAKGYRLDTCSSWATMPFGSRMPDVKSMDHLHNNIQGGGVKLLYSWDSNRQPHAVCYFFPCR